MRIVTRSDFDGVVCAVLLFEALEKDHDLNPVIFWTEPGEVQAGTADIKKGDILANLPWHKDCSLWFDHHISNKPDQAFEGAFDVAPSAAGVIYKYYKQQGKLDRRFDDLVENADMIDSADLNMDQVMTPEKYPWVILSMTLKNRNYEDIPYWNHLVSLLRSKSVDDILKDPEVAARRQEAIDENTNFIHHLKDHTKLHGKVSVTDFSSFEVVPVGNRFLIYSLFPETVASMKIRYKDKEKTKILLSVGRSIFNQGCRVNIGELLSRYGGGGHAGAGGCTLDANGSAGKIQEILDIMKTNQPLSAE